MPFPVVPAVTVHHAELLEVVQAVFDVTVNEVEPASVPTFWFAGDTDRVGVAPAWVTVTVTGVDPDCDTVILAIRCVSEVFSVQLAVIVPFPVPDAVTVHHV